jgi:SAM-dependent methyltransferase
VTERFRARLRRVEIPHAQLDLPVETVFHERIVQAKSLIEQFHDRWTRDSIEQFVPADYDLVYRSLRAIVRYEPLIGNRFLEWGCGFGVVTAFAYELGLDAIGVEAESTLLEQAKRLLAQWQVPAQLEWGNFVPAGGELLVDDPNVPSLSHPVPNVYGKLGLEIDDFAVIYAYPWPGEDDFFESLFARYAAKGAYLIQFRGPNDVRVLQKIG